MQTLMKIVGLGAILSIVTACTMTQPPAQVESGTTNPYGTPQTNTPYSPPVDNQSSSVDTQPATTGTYIPSNAPVDINAQTHTVVPGDTVYNIAKRYGISQDSLMQWNNLADYNIRVGQVLKVKGNAVLTSNIPSQGSTATTSNNTTTSPSSATGTKVLNGITWSKPSAGSVIANFSANNKGIEYGGNLGAPVLAAADGKVVYSGSGLKGYGNLLIIQHNSQYLTAYGNNQSLLVQVGQMVKRGQKIATMGNTDSDRVKLHFEIRENGKPVNPVKFLP